MKTIKTTVKADASGRAVLQLELAPGAHEVIVLIQDDVELASERNDYSFIDLPSVSIGTWPEGFTLRREDLYDDD